MALPSAFASLHDCLPDYLLAVRQLLHDPSWSYFSDQDLTGYINEARSFVAVQTGALRQIQVVTLPAGQGQFRIGGLIDFTTPIPPPTGSIPPLQAVSGGDGQASASTAQVPMTVAVTVAGSYYQPPIVSIDAQTPGMNVSAWATARLLPFNGVAPSQIAEVYVTYDGGQYAANTVTPAISFIPAGQPATLGTDSNGNMTVLTSGSGQRNGVVILDSLNGIYPLAPSAVTLIDDAIAAIDQVTCIWGGLRVPLQNLAYTDFSMATRSVVNFQSTPSCFSLVGRTLYIGPTPSSSYQYELDCIMFPQPLLDYVTLGPIMDDTVLRAVPYYAAYKAKLTQGEQQEASSLLALYQNIASLSVNSFTTRHSILYPDDDL